MFAFIPDEILMWLIFAAVLFSHRFTEWAIRDTKARRLLRDSRKP
jgi:hypothetical protein